jgi:hypothetical protein
LSIYQTSQLTLFSEKSALCPILTLRLIKSRESKLSYGHFIVLDTNLSGLKNKYIENLNFG